MNLIIQYGLLGLVLGLGLGLGFILYCRIWRPWHYVRYMCPQPLEGCLLIDDCMARGISMSSQSFVVQYIGMQQ